MDKAKKSLRDFAKAHSSRNHLVVAGVDPSVKTLAAAIVYLDLETGELGPAPEFVVVRGNGRKDMSRLLRGCLDGLPQVGDLSDVVMVEDQKVRESGRGKTKNPENLIPLAQTAGIAAACCGLADTVEFVQPSVWKGSASKEANHKKTLRAMGWRGRAMSGYVIPEHWDDECVTVYGGGPGVLKSDWKEIMDALGIALWAAHELHIAYRTARALRRNRKR